MTRFAAALLAASLLTACSVLPDSPAPSRSGGQASSSGQSRPSQGSAPVAVSAAERQCLSTLDKSGVQFTPLPDQYTGQGCSTIGTVQMSALRGDVSTMAIGNIGPVQCGVGNAFAAWVRFGVDRAARQLLGSGVQRIETFGSYSCRNVAGSARRSAHATAGAIDVAAFVLDDGRRVTVADDWNGGSRAEKEFLRTVQQSACRRFDTVLGPEYNAAHRDHFHVEGVLNGGNSFCR